MKRPVSIIVTCALTLAVTANAQVPNWTEIKPTTAPVPRQNSAMAYDANRNVCVLFGAWDGTMRRNDTWEWNGVTWTEIKPANSPSPRDGMALAYDSVRKVTVLTAGYVNRGETWEYDGTNWTLKNTANTHNLGPHNPMAFDANRKVCVLVGGNPVETWEYDGINWVKQNPATSPPATGSLAYDSLRQQVVLYTGSSQTWEYDGNWRRVNTTTVPPGRGCAAGLVYDSARQVCVMFGGCGAGVGGDTWEYDGTDWLQIKTLNAPSAPRRYVAMAYDAGRRTTVLFGGRDFSGPTQVIVGDTWEYNRPPCYMGSDIASIDITKGGTQTLTLDAGTSHAAHLYWIFGSMTGTGPGFFFNGAHLYLNPDPYSILAIGLTNSSFLQNFRGALDAQGKATAKFVIPPGLVTGTITLHHAYAMYLGGPNICTGNPVRLELK